MKQKVLFVATVDSHIELFHSPYLKMFKDRGFEVHVATDTDKPIKYCDKKIKLPIKRSPFKLSNIKAIRQLKKIVNTEKYNIIHCHTPMGGVVTRLAAKKARKNGTRVIYTAHGFHFYKGAPLKNWLFFYPVEKRLSKFTDTLITINTEDFERAKKKFGKRCLDIQYVPGVGVDEKKFEKKLSAKEKSELRKSLGLKDDDKVLICIGRLDKNKNQGFLIKAIEKLDDNYHLLLVGPDEINGKYQKLADKLAVAKRVHFLGYRDDIEKLLQISDIAISASKREGLPVNLMEAAFLGIPIVATDCRGNRDIAEKTGGSLVGQDNLQDFCNKIIAVPRGIKKQNVDNINLFVVSDVVNRMDRIYNVDNNSNLLFVHDTRFIRKDNGYYTTNGLTYEYLKGYLRFFKNLVVVGREERKEIDRKRMAVSSGDKVAFSCINELNLYSIFFGKTKRMLRDNIRRSDFVIIRLPSFLGMRACSLCKKYNKPYLIELVGCHFDALWYYGKITYKIVAIGMLFVNKKLVRDAKNVIYVTRDFLQQRYPNHHNNIGISDVQISKADIIVSNNTIRKYEKASNYKIGLIGSLDIRLKGQDLAIRALSEIVKTFPNVELHLLGPCSDKKREYWINYAEKYGVKDRVFLDGTLPSGNSILYWLDGLDFFINVSLSEGLSRSLVEAMSRGLICFGTGVGGTTELLDDNQLIRKRNPKMLAAKILECINDNDLSAKYSKKDSEKAKQYETGLLQKQRDDFYTKVVGFRELKA